MMGEETSKEIRILLMGKSGSGKSSVGNQLCGSKVFQVSMNNGTKQSQLARRTLEDGGELVIVDTPGYCNIKLTEEETQKEINRGMELLAPGPHCVIFVFNCLDRVTGDNIKRIKDLQSIFDIYLHKHGLVVFTGIDDIGEEGQTLDEYIQTLPQQLKEFLNHLGTSPIGVTARQHTDKNSSSKIIQAVNSTYERLSNSFIENSIIRKRKGDVGCVSAVETKMARKDNEPCNNKITVLLLGKSGIGKSSVGNVLLGEKKFVASMMEERGTKTCQIEESDQLLVVDTPGFFSPLRSDVDTAKEIINTIKLRLKSIHVCILVLSADDRFSGSEDKALEFVSSLFGGEIPAQLMCVFTGKDSLEDDNEPFLFPKNLPNPPHPILDCKGYTQKDRDDLLSEIRLRLDNPISPKKVDNALLNQIATTEKRRKKASEGKSEAYRRALNPRFQRGFLQRICDWVLRGLGFGRHG